MTAIALCLASPARADAESAGTVLGMLSYVREQCPAFRPNPSKIKEIFTGQGYPPEIYVDSLPQDVLAHADRVFVGLKGGKAKDNCAQIWRQFGPSTTNFSDTLLRK